ncbi:heterokaryon incompatibility protein-domain-containing protein [Lasiosphaeria hispida]|uniref:Heterokaryon incompatibility protein-domain-containing protein n=1 Tax=Lasiosphaeria hispida TaxID=260671 RepID=A0AAJ0HG86_9PEZI|nr:heterokaryon incompatibility protein-domain-containing protein [Lasiosphaeria hispida]
MIDFPQSRKEHLQLASSSIMDSPLYHPLRVSGREIRLLEIENVSDDGAVSCRLETVQLDQNPQFVALSYLWGDASKMESVMVNGREMVVTINLAAALRHVRDNWSTEFPSRPPREFRIWADALCINQADIAERGQQVMLMADIYSSAEVVFAWLGSGKPELEVALETVGIVANELYKIKERGSSLYPFFTLGWMEKYSFLCKDDSQEGYSQRWREIGFLFNMRYWRRVWVMQELALARCIFLVYGKKMLEFDVLNPLGMLARVMSKTNLFLPTKPPFVDQQTWIGLKTGGLVDWKLMKRIIMLREMILQRPKAENPVKVQVESWSNALLGFALQATDPRDHVYGLLGLTQLDIVPDYSLKTPLADVYIQYTQAWLQFNREHEEFISKNDSLLAELWFLQFTGLGHFKDTLGFPTWAPNFPQMQRENITTLAGSNCEADQHVFPRNTPAALIEGNSLLVSGVIIDTVSHVAPFPRSEQMAPLRQYTASVNNMSAPIGRQNMPPMETLQPLMDLAGGALRPFFDDFVSRHSVYTTGIPPLQAIFRAYMRDGKCSPGETASVALGFVGTLVGMSCVASPERRARLAGPEGVLPESLGFPGGVTGNRAFSAVFAPGGGAVIDIGVGEGKRFAEATFQGAGIGELTDAHMYNEDIHPLRNSWRFFETSRGYIGIGPDLIQAGDVVAVLKGSRRPAVLRPGEGAYRHVGLCYVEGLVRGEARELVREGKCRVERLKVV